MTRVAFLARVRRPREPGRASSHSDGLEHTSGPEAKIRAKSPARFERRGEVKIRLRVQICLAGLPRRADLF